MTKKKGNPLKNLVLISHIGNAMISPIVMGLYLGKWIDGKLNTSPLFLLIFIIVGIIAGFINVFKVTMQDIKKS